MGNWSRIRLACLTMALWGLIVGQATAVPIMMRWTDSDGMAQKEQFNLADPKQQRRFREIFQGIPSVAVCFERADYAVYLLNMRDKGQTESDHLSEVRGNYERTTNEPEGAVAWHIYVDFQRMVRDIHRHGPGGYRYTNADVVWDKEFRWCFEFFRGNGSRRR